MEQPQPQLPMTEENPKPAPMSLGARLMNIYVAPSEVFEEVKVSPLVHVNWVVPLITAMIAGIVFVMVAFSQPKVIQGIRDAQEKSFQKMVASGQKTQQQVDQISAMAEKWTGPAVLKVFGILGCIFMCPVMLFFIAFLFWLVGKYGFHGSFGYMKAVEASGLSMMINVLGALVSMLLVVIYGNLAMNAGPVLLLDHFDQYNKIHVILSALDVMSLWYLSVLSLGLARLSGGSFIKAAIWMFGLWYGIWAVFKLGPLFLFGGK